MFRYEFMTLTQIGEIFGITSHQVGKWLVQIGLQTEAKRPSAAAFDGDFLSQGPSRSIDGYNWVWHSVRTVAALEKAGHRRISNPPPDLVDPPSLNGPFVSRTNEANGFDIVNGDGLVVVVVTGEKNADFILRLLNLAHRRRKCLPAANRITAPASATGQYPQQNFCNLQTQTSKRLAAPD